MRIAHSILDGLFPTRCVVCGRGGAVACSACLATTRYITPPFCLRCGLPLSPGRSSCQQCQRTPLALSGLRAVSLYETPLDACIRAFKYHRQRRLAEPLGQLLARAFSRYQLHADVVIPVPLHPTREQQRQYNQSALLARVCAREIAVPLDEYGLTRIRETPPQASLAAEQRYHNVIGAFAYQSSRATHTVLNRNILIIDDVSTTGCTLSACAEMLWRAGAREIWGLVLARPTSRQALKPIEPL